MLQAHALELIHDKHRGHFMRMERGSGSIYHDKNRRKGWIVRAPAEKIQLENGKTRYVSKLIGTYYTQQEALSALSKYNNCPWNLWKTPTFEKVFRLWLEEKQLDGISQSAVNSYTAAFKLCSEIHTAKLKALRLAHLQKILNDNAGKSKSTVTNIGVVIHGVFEYAMRNDYITKDYSQYIKCRYKVSEDKHRALTAAEINSVFNWEQSEIKDITVILLFTGFRINELLELPLTGVNLKDWYFQGGKKTRAGKNRVVPIHDSIKPLVKKCYRAAENNNRLTLFTLNDSQYRQELQTKGGFLPHDTRHTFITALQNAGADKVCIERLAGHSSKGITDSVYTHKDIEQLRAAVDMLSYSYSTARSKEG